VLKLADVRRPHQTDSDTRGRRALAPVRPLSKHAQLRIPLAATLRARRPLATPSERGATVGTRARRPFGTRSDRRHTRSADCSFPGHCGTHAESAACEDLRQHEQALVAVLLCVNAEALAGADCALELDEEEHYPLSAASW
jgi:hypothetical protein